MTVVTSTQHTWLNVRNAGKQARNMIVKHGTSLASSRTRDWGEVSQSKHYSLGWMQSNEDRTYHGMFNNIILLRKTKGWLMRFHQVSYVNCVICKPQNITLVMGNIWQAVSSLLTNSTLGNLANDIINTTYLTDLHLQFIRNSFPAELCSLKVTRHIRAVNVCEVLHLWEILGLRQSVWVKTNNGFRYPKRQNYLRTLWLCDERWKQNHAFIYKCMYICTNSSHALHTIAMSNDEFQWKREWT